jgi:hypothetical protein
MSFVISDVFIVDYHTKLKLLSSSISLVVAIKSKVKENVLMALCCYFTLCRNCHCILQRFVPNHDFWILN